MNMLSIDGSHGEGGGQVLRTCLALSAITGRPVRIENIRAGRRKPGLRPQHLTGVRAAAKICAAKAEGAKLNAQVLTFVPGAAPQSGDYTFDVAQAAKGGSAGSVSLILQTVLLPLALAEGTSKLTLRGGTHVSWSPAFDFIKRVYLPTLGQAGLKAKANIRKWGWYPLGGGEVQVTVQGSTEGALLALDRQQRGSLVRVRGLSASSNLPKHIRIRQERAALQALRSSGINARIDVVDAPSKGQGTVVFVWAEFEHALAGFTSLGQRGKPAEQVAGDACEDLLDFVKGSSALDRYLADQLLLPLAVAKGTSRFTTERVTQHLLTNAWAINQFLPGCVQVEGEEGQPAGCRIEGTG